MQATAKKTTSVQATIVDNAEGSQTFKVKKSVVKNDIASHKVASIKMGEVGPKAKVSLGDITGPALNLEAMEKARINWEGNELAASNKRLYSILQSSYRYYLGWKKNPNKESRKAIADDLEKFMKQRGYPTLSNSHDMNRVVKCVFGVDRRRVSAYSIALREALRQEVSADDLIDFIEANGGVEQIRLGGTKPLSIKDRAEEVKEEVLSADLGMISFDDKLFAGDPDWTDKQVVIVATYFSTGEFQANAVIRDDSAVNAALAAYCSKQKEKARKDAAVEREAIKFIASEAAKAGKASARKVQGKSNKADKKAEATRSDAATKAQFNNLYEVVE
jgi:hypothetical protein